MRILGLMIAVLVCGSLIADEAPLQTATREWKSADGNFTTTARLEGFGPEGLVLVKADGSRSKVPLSRLSADDRSYAIERYNSWEGRPSLGLGLQDLKELKKRLTSSRDSSEDVELGKVLPDRSGMIIIKVVPGGPGEHGGARTLDILTHIGDMALRDKQTYQEAMMAVVGREEVPIRVQRQAVKGKSITWQPVTLTLRPITRAELTKKEEAAEEKEKSLGPLRITSAHLQPNSIGDPELVVKVRNVAKSPVVAFTIRAACYDNFDEEVRAIGETDNLFGGVSQETIEVGSERTATWTLSLQDKTTRAEVHVARVRLDDGTEWRAKNATIGRVTAKRR